MLARQNSAELAALPDAPGLEFVLTAWRAGMPQLWPVLTGWDGEDPWDFLLTASGRDPGWLQILQWCAAAE